MLQYPLLEFLTLTSHIQVRKKTVFKRKIKQILFEILASDVCYIDLPVIIQKVKLNLFSS